MTHTATISEGEPVVLRIKIRGEPMGERAIKCQTCGGKIINPITIQEHLGHELEEVITTVTRLTVEDDLDMVGFLIDCGWQPVPALERVISIKNQEVRTDG